jgi:hypothetical protein
MKNDHSVSVLWEAHLARHFPRSATEVELGGLDIANLSEIDAFLAGYVSRVAEGRSLPPRDIEAFARASMELNTQLPALTGCAAVYFAGLAAAANAALLQCQS